MPNLLRHFCSAPCPGQAVMASINARHMRTKILRRPALLAVVFFLLVVWTALSGIAGATVLRHYLAERWPAAERIFHSDPRWLGGDGATSVDLGDNRVLWLFGDSFLDLAGSGQRSSAALVRNTIAVQSGYDPTTAAMAFAWRMGADRPAAFFDAPGPTWYWPSSGIRLGRHLLVFLMEIRAAQNDLGFEACGWKAAWIGNPGDEPNRWQVTWLISPQRQGLVVGAGNPLLSDGFLRVFAVDGRDRNVYLARWPEAAARSGTLTRPEWWTGETTGWVADPAGRQSLAPVFADGQMEFSVTCLPELRQYVRVQTLSLMNPCLAVSTAGALTGPWSTAACFFTPPEQGDPQLLIYAGKSHPALRGAAAVFSYVVNTTSAERLFSDMDLYFPMMLKSSVVDGPMP